MKTLVDKNGTLFDFYKTIRKNSLLKIEHNKTVSNKYWISNRVINISYIETDVSIN